MHSLLQMCAMIMCSIKVCPIPLEESCIHAMKINCAYLNSGNKLKLIELAFKLCFTMFLKLCLTQFEFSHFQAASLQAGSHWSTSVHGIAMRAKSRGEATRQEIDPAWISATFLFPPWKLRKKLRRLKRVLAACVHANTCAS